MEGATAVTLRAHFHICRETGMSIQLIAGSAFGAPTTTPGVVENASPTRSPPIRAANESQTTGSEVSREEVTKAVKATNEFVGSINDALQFSIDDETGKTVVKVIDSNTQEVIKQIPSEEMIAIAKALDKLKGLLLQQKA